MKQQGDKLHRVFNMWWISHSTSWKIPEMSLHCYTSQTLLSVVAWGRGWGE